MTRQKIYQRRFRIVVGTSRLDLFDVPFFAIGWLRYVWCDNESIKRFSWQLWTWPVFTLAVRCLKSSGILQWEIGIGKPDNAKAGPKYVWWWRQVPYYRLVFYMGIQSSKVIFGSLENGERCMKGYGSYWLHIICYQHSLPSWGEDNGNSTLNTTTKKKHIHCANSIFQQLV